MERSSAFVNRTDAKRPAPTISSTLAVDVVGIGAWTPRHRDWPALADAFAGRAVEAHATPRPSAALLPPAERRRAPEGVSVALEVAREAVLDAASRGIEVASLPSVFASAHGDLVIVDYLAATLAADPLALSPTRFHLSVHNAASGYWSIATGDRAASTAVAGGDDSFALGLLEAATQAVAGDRPVLFVSFDTPATGLLVGAIDNTALFGFALVLAPLERPASIARVGFAVRDGRVSLPSPDAATLRAFASTSPAARGLAFAEAVAVAAAAAVARTLAYPLGSATSLAIRVEPPAIE